MKTAGGKADSTDQQDGEKLVERDGKLYRRTTAGAAAWANEIF